MDAIKASNRFTDYCQTVYESENSLEFMISSRLAQTYSKAIRDICGGQVWLEIIEFVDDVMRSRGIESICGVPTQYKNEKQLQDA